MPPRAVTSGRRLNNVSIALHLFGTPAAPEAPPSPPLPQRVCSGPGQPAFLDFLHGATNKDSLARRRGSSSSRRRPWRRGSFHGAGLGRGARGWAGAHPWARAQARVGLGGRQVSGRALGSRARGLRLPCQARSPPEPREGIRAAREATAPRLPAT